MQEKNTSMHKFSFTFRSRGAWEQSYKTHRSSAVHCSPFMFSEEIFSHATLYQNLEIRNKSFLLQKFPAILWEGMSELT